MKKMKRILCFQLVLALLLCMWPTASAVEGEGIALTMTASGSSVQVGEEVILTIGTEQDFVSRGSGMTVYYDDAVLKLDLDASDAAEPFRIDGPLTVNGKTALRVSFLPGLEAEEFFASEPLAELHFRAIGVTEETAIGLDAAYLYDETLDQIFMTRPADIRLTLEASQEESLVAGITLDQTSLTLEEGETAVLIATLEPEDAPHDAVIWTSSDERVAQVTGGTIKAVSAGEATIKAATKDGTVEASCVVTVHAPDAGYTVSMPGDISATIGETIKIPVTVRNTEGKTGYNAFDMRFTYDPGVLELVTTKLAGMTLQASSGKVQVLAYGEDRSIGSVPFTLEFKVLQAENTDVQLSSASVDNSGNAVTKNTALATLTDDRTAITVKGYGVNLPEAFAGADHAVPKEDYTFAVPQDYYDYQLTVTVDGNKIEVAEDENGTYTIPGAQITGEIVITATKMGKFFGVTLGRDMTGSTSAQYGVDYTAKLTKDEDYSYQVNVTIGGKTYTGYGVYEDAYTIPGGDITGDIVFAVTKTLINEPDSSEPTEPSNPTEPTTPSEPTDPTESTTPGTTTKPSTGTTSKPSSGTTTKYSVTFTGSGAGAAQGNATTVARGGSYTLKLKMEEGYDYVVSYRMGGNAAVTVSPTAKGVYVIYNVTASLEIIIEKAPQRTVEVTEYLTLDGKAVFLVEVNGYLASGKIFAFDGNPMYFSEVYDSWIYLTMEDTDFAPADGEKRVSTVTGEKNMLVDSGCDVNGTGAADLRDVQLIYDLYNGIYSDFITINMVKFLNADRNFDKKIDVRDAVAVAFEIMNSKEA